MSEVLRLEPIVLISDKSFTSFYVQGSRCYSYQEAKFYSGIILEILRPFLKFKKFGCF